MPELIWEGKYDKDGRKVAPLRIALPFQTVETINESTADRERNLLFASMGRETEWRNRLIWGDKKYVLPSLLPEFAGKVNLIYIDPPFATGADFSFTARIPDNPETEEDESAEFVKQPSMIEIKAYRDTWGGGLDSYLKWFYETVVLLRELLAEDGSIYVHCDWHAGHYIKAVMDEVFGEQNFKNDIAWYYRRWTAVSYKYQNLHDNLLFYTKAENYIFNEPFEPYGDWIKKDYQYVDEQGRRWRWHTVKGVRYKVYLENEDRGVRVGDVWQIPYIASTALERVDFPTQKPEALLERIIKASSNEGDLVLDCFCGSGTTPAVAEKLNRRWIAADLSKYAIHITRKRLLSIPNVKPFVIQNLGKYERQIWQSAEFGEDNQRRQLEYRKFILDLYHAKPVNGYEWLHGIKSGRMVHIGSVDSPVTESDITNIASEFKRAIGKGENAPSTNGIDILGWDFAFEVNEIARAKAELAGLDLKFKKIPIDVMDPKAVEQGDIHFYQLAALKVKPQLEKRKLTIELSDFIIPQEDIPEDVRSAISHWSQWVDYWAIDWDFKGDTFHNQWQSYRTKKNNDLQLKTSYIYDKPGKYTVAIKVVDILGNDTTKRIQVEVK